MPYIKIKSSVGIGGTNNYKDIKSIQGAMNEILDLIPPTRILAVDGSLGRNPEKSKTVAAIKVFQKKLVHMINPDGRIDPNGRSHKFLNRKLVSRPSKIKGSMLPKIKGTKDLDDSAFQKAANKLGCEIEAIKAVALVEAAGSGFFSSGLPKILFEAHIFSRETKRIFDKSHPNISSRRWNKSLYLGGVKEYNRLKSAMKLDRAAAIRSSSWGKFQIMGFNYQSAGYSSLEKFLNDMFHSESKQLDAFVSFLISNKLHSHLRHRNWAQFAKGYNGPAYAKNKYDEKLKTAYNKLKLGK